MNARMTARKIATPAAPVFAKVDGRTRLGKLVRRAAPANENAVAWLDDRYVAPALPVDVTGHARLDIPGTILGLLGGRTASAMAITVALMQAGATLDAALLGVRDAKRSGLLVPRVPGRASGGWCCSGLAC